MPPKKDNWTRKREAYQALAVMAEERAANAHTLEQQRFLASAATAWRLLDEVAAAIQRDKAADFYRPAACGGAPQKQSGPLDQRPGLPAFMG